MGFAIATLIVIGFFFGVKLSMLFEIVLAIILSVSACIFAREELEGLLYHILVVSFCIGMLIGDIYVGVKYKSVREPFLEKASNAITWLFTPSGLETNNQEKTEKENK